MGILQPIKATTDYKKFFSVELQNLLTYIEEVVSKEYNFAEVTPEIFFTAALENKDWMLYKALNGFYNTITIEKILGSLVDIVKDNELLAVKPGRKITYSGELQRLFVKANDERAALGSDVTTSDHVLLSALKNLDAKNEVKRIFESEGLNYDILVGISKKLHSINETIVEIPDEIKAKGADEEGEEVGEDEVPQTLRMITLTPRGPMDITQLLTMNHAMNPANVKGAPQQTATVKKAKVTATYCTSLNALAERGQIDNIIGREKEINDIIRIFNRRKNNNVLLVGNAGVGKTAIVEGLAKMIVEKKAPAVLENKEILRLNIGAIMGGTQYRGVFEERMTNLVKELKSNKNAILFIDDIHSLIGEKQKSEFDAMGLLSELFTDSATQVIATTTYKGYKSCFENSDATSRKFQTIDVEPTNDSDTIDILNGIKPLYEKYHHVHYTDEAVNASVTLSKRYITNRNLPTSAIDILDEAGATKKIDTSSTSELEHLKFQLWGLESKKADLIREDKMDEAKAMEGSIDAVKVDINEKRESLESVISDVTIDDIYKAISIHTNIPVAKIKVSEKKSVADIDKTLKQTIVGQDEAIETVSRAIKRSKVGLMPANKPLGSFMCIGSTGCGKTLMAKVIAKEIFGDEKKLVRLDMSEYADKASVSKLIGSSAGYVGYDNGGVLTEAIKKNKHCVLLIDEIEKADPTVYNTFLQILDEGFVTDNNGIKVDFKNTIVIFTSNVGTKEAAYSKGIGFNVDVNANKKSIIEKELKKQFPPEFLNRLDNIVYFNILTDDNLKAIIVLELNKLNERLKGIKCSMTYTDGVIDYIFSIISKEKEFGARPIVRAIQTEIENRITDALLETEDSEIEFHVSVEDEIIKIEH